MKNIILIMALFSTLFGANAQKSDTIKILAASDFNKAIEKNNVQLVDVRTAQEFNQGAIESALNIDFFQQDNFTSEFEKLDKDQPVYLYCRSGNRSYQAAKKLEVMGFKEIYDLKGGYMKWPYKN
ncbi:rhodanese-like domain-containing protein [Patiriisocius hiemis]|uniref:Rhodanese-like domain-containing protein n=1 Tax=Patiriisocius hiemis TaxID=3075604 RepID=A0ABU2YDD1_9FLAO|nr:rhodanese-like domain-containing protein [Constantimarinum sp. W242]MDT0556192.1 rhodanese-like domain-containing protein [Constantimarinum sp. W242]